MWDIFSKTHLKPKGKSCGTLKLGRNVNAKGLAEIHLENLQN